MRCKNELKTFKDVHFLTLKTSVIQVPPHLFAASDAAYQQMMNNTKDQSMLVS